MTVLSARHDVKCMFTTPKLLDALCNRLEKEGTIERVEVNVGVDDGLFQFPPAGTPIEIAVGTRSSGATAIVVLMAVGLSRLVVGPDGDRGVRRET